ncbi:fructose PTS transporter subunit IIA [Enterococcus faecium]|uniref:fructose PTS transporter subunit IIA n=1 Tax=Enterococcus faecium TaxID=1352 RepID=UPI0007AE5921|nr:fructose PTS transporter subunit IIA [Enterococcus faecium]KZK36101.1 PTS fructose transporter subunit IIA [Enterococcus faecium]MDQ8217578.1 fructose PTS transporter subunit IIA [Enterococcus faecium]MDQ8461317.1 fructose PTS transporter subunit IIA [Enterococcus faecium]
MTIIHEENIFLQQPLDSQEEAFKFLAKQTFCLGITHDEKEVYQKLLEREKEGTTGIMSGFAIPHAKSQTINEPSMINVTLNKGILDRQSVDFIFALFIPDSEAGTTHLKLLSLVARSLMRKEVTEQLRKAKSKTEIATILTKEIGEDL